MYDVLDQYQQPYAPLKSRVCVDENSKQLLADTPPPIPGKPGRPTKYDYEYERKGTANIFVGIEPPSMGAGFNAAEIDYGWSVYEGTFPRHRDALYRSTRLGHNAGTETRSQSPGCLRRRPRMLRGLSEAKTRR